MMPKIRPILKQLGPLTCYKGNGTRAQYRREA
jgi:hypothetical protein